MNKAQKIAEWLTPEKRAEHARIRAELDAEYPELKEKSRESRRARMRHGATPHRARYLLIGERSEQGLSDDDMMTRSGLDADALASMYGRDAKPTIETMEAYAKALGKKLLIVLADEDEG